MSLTTCARSGGAYLFRCIKDQDLYWPLAQMQRDMDGIAEAGQRLRLQMVETSRRCFEIMARDLAAIPLQIHRAEGAP